MGQMIQIQSDSDFLERGQTYEIPIVVELDKPLKRVRNVTAQFHAAERAEAEYTVTVTDSEGDTKTETRTAVAYHTIVKEDFVLHGGPSAGFFRGLGDSVATMFGGGSSGTLSAGRHEFSVGVTIPENAPPSMEGKICEVFYKLSVRIDRALARDPKENKSFTVVPVAQQLDPQPVVARYPDEENTGFWARTFGRKANLTLVISADSFVPGDELDCMFGVETESPMKIRAAKARILCIEKTRADGHTDSSTHCSKDFTIADKQTIDDQFSTRFVLPLESIGPPTTGGHVFDIDWYVEVTLDVPWATDPVIRAPIQVVFP